MIEHRYRQTKSQAPKELTMAIGCVKLQYVWPFEYRATFSKTKFGWGSRSDRNTRRQSPLSRI